jgi:hypothetical protein
VLCGAFEGVERRVGAVTLPADPPKIVLGHSRNSETEASRMKAATAAASKAALEAAPARYDWAWRTIRIGCSERGDPGIQPRAAPNGVVTE